MSAPLSSSGSKPAVYISTETVKGFFSADKTKEKEMDSILKRIAVPPVFYKVKEGDAEWNKALDGIKEWAKGKMTQASEGEKEMRANQLAKGILYTLKDPAKSPIKQVDIDLLVERAATNPLSEKEHVNKSVADKELVIDLTHVCPREEKEYVQKKVAAIKELEQKIKQELGVIESFGNETKKSIVENLDKHPDIRRDDLIAANQNSEDIVNLVKNFKDNFQKKIPDTPEGVDARFNDAGAFQMEMRKVKDAVDKQHVKIMKRLGQEVEVKEQEKK